jgi:DNA mismatch endonuclease (patch repair protein)
VAPSVRSRTMAAVRSTGNRSTERVLRAHLVRNGFRGWRLNAKDVAGCPDFVFDEQRLAVFVDGCFWHGCPACHRLPGSNQKYWTDKVGGNRKRDRKTTRELLRADWAVLRIWEHELKRSPRSIMRRILRALGEAGV